MSKDRPTSEPGGCECMKCGAIFIGGPAHDECGECAAPARESVADALLIVESYGPWGPDLNDAHRRQIVLADEVLTLRSRLAHWRAFGMHAEDQRCRWKVLADGRNERLSDLGTEADRLARFEDWLADRAGPLLHIDDVKKALA